MDSAADNYRYWREHGTDWHTEYDRRKKLQVCYHCQQIMIAQYFQQSAPARILEFGCGIGRHLRYLNAIPGLEVHGYDQSPQMVAGMQAWAEPAWLGARVRTGPAVGKLPYPDGAFDVVFTAEVLVHVRPEDLASILAELVRVARWQVIHFETSADYQLKVNAHGGCWYHDLCGAYGEIGYLCETLPAGYRVHQPYRVVLDASRPLPEASQILPMLLRRLETDIQGTLDDWSGVGQRMQRLASDGPQACAAAADLQSDPVVLAGKYCDLISARIDAEGEAKAHAEQAQAALLTELAAERSRHAALRQDLAAERDRRSILESESNQVQADLARLESSLGQRMLRRLRRMPGFPLLRSALQAALAVRAKCDFAFDFRRMWRGQRSR